MSDVPRPDLAPAVERMVVALAQAVFARTVYPAAHSQTRQAIAHACGACERVLEIRGADSTSLLVVGGELVVDQRPLPRGALFQRGLVDQLERRGLEGVTISRGLTGGELEGFLDGMVSPAGPRSTPHLLVGRVEVVAGGVSGSPLARGELVEEAGQGASEAGLGGALAQARDAFTGEGAAAGERRKPLDLRRFEAAVAPLVLALPRGMLRLPELPATTGDAGSEALFRHSLRVALLAVALGRALGAEGARLRELGLAALLHDVGKLELPAELLGRAALGESGRALLATHTARGAALLARSEGDSSLAALVAYEHHLRWDGKPTFPPLATPRRPLPASQVVAVADTYDVARNARPGPPAATHRAALALLAHRAGTWLDPGLVAAFTRLLTPRAPAAASPGS